MEKTPNMHFSRCRTCKEFIPWMNTHGHRCDRARASSKCPFVGQKMPSHLIKDPIMRYHPGILENQFRVTQEFRNETSKVDSHEDTEHKNKEENPQRKEDIKVDSDEATEYKILKQLQKDFEGLQVSGEDCDVTIKVQGEEFLVHRGILRARSPVFKSMFSHEMAEKLSGEVVVDDCDPETFPDFLNYLYTGNIQHISDENVCQLYTTSDKYQVDGLKEVCKAYMKRNLSVNSFCDILTLSLQHTDKELTDVSTEFFCTNAKEIIETAKWQTFLKENSIVGNELFLKYLSKEKK